LQNLGAVPVQNAIRIELRKGVGREVVVEEVRRSLFAGIGSSYVGDESRRLHGHRLQPRKL
jgi:hypothetical protein